MNACCITFDVDMQVSKNGKTVFVDEFEYCFPQIAKQLEKNDQVKTTWFLRLDNQMKEIYGRPDYLFSEHAKEIKWLREHGHQLAWHIHPYAKSENGQWIQNTNSEKIAEEVYQNQKLAKEYGISGAVRFGWCYQSNELMKLMDEIGCRIDSSAIPRPKYSWANQFSDWSLCGQRPYYPSPENYQVSGKNSMKILEVPMTTTHIATSYDNGQKILRYINPAYHHKIFIDAYKQLDGDCVLITHPAENFSLWDCSHELLSYNVGVFGANIAAAAKTRRCITLETYQKYLEGSI